MQGMALYQNTHLLATNKMNKPLVTSGADKTIAMFTSNEFVFKAMDDGVVKEIDDKNNLIFLEYKDKSIGIIDTELKSHRSPDGFYINVKLDSNLKVGDKFKESDILAADSHFFDYKGNETSLYQGTLAKCIIAPLNNTYEDSSVITEEFAEKLTANITMMTEITLTPKANLEYLVKIGNKVKTADKLAIFEEVFEDEEGSISKMLASLGSEFEDAIEAIGKNVKTSKYTGEIVDIRLTYTRPVEEYSPSIQKLLKDYIAKHSNIANKLEVVRKDQLTDLRGLEALEQVDIPGIKFDGIKIEIYTRMKDYISVGDKLSLSVALKSIVSDIIDKGKEPYSEYKKDENIDIAISPMSVTSRMCVDLWYTLFTNKVLVTLKDKIKELS
jgi:DNA-directed RNA polymerase beta subunit